MVDPTVGVPPRARAHALTTPSCQCGRVLDVPRPVLPTDPPVTVTCECGGSGLASLNLDWYVREAMNDAIEAGNV